MAEVKPGTTENTIPAVDTDGPARAARVSGVISTILASPNIAAIKAALGDPEVNAAASSDMGVATLVGVLTSAGSAEEAKVIRELQPTVAEKKQIIDAIAAPAQAAVVTAADANVVAAGGALKQGDTVIASGTAVTPNGDVGGASMVANKEGAGVAGSVVSPTEGTVVSTAASSTGAEALGGVSKANEVLAKLGLEQKTSGMTLGGDAKKPAA